jgi:hypothetical protein
MMTGGVPVLQDSDTLGITVRKIDEGSDEEILQIKLTLTKPVPEQALSFTVKKQRQGAADLVSKPVTYTIHYQGAPTITDSPATAMVGWRQHRSFGHEDLRFHGSSEALERRLTKEGPKRRRCECSGRQPGLGVAGEGDHNVARRRNGWRLANHSQVGHG